MMRISQLAGAMGRPLFRALLGACLASASGPQVVLGEQRRFISRARGGGAVSGAISADNNDPPSASHGPAAASRPLEEHSDLGLGNRQGVDAAQQVLQRPRLLAEAMARVQKSLRVAPSFPGARLGERTDMRPMSKEALHRYVASTLQMAESTAGDSAQGTWRTRVPLCVIQGAMGTGKTALLLLAGHWFTESNDVHRHWKSLFVTVGHTRDQCFDENSSTRVRLAHRLLCAAIGAQSSSRYVEVIDVLRRELGLPRIKNKTSTQAWYAEPEILVQALRTALGVGDDDHLLLAVDELRKLRDRSFPPALLGSVTHEIADCLQFLGDLSQASFSCRKGAGVVFFVATALSAFDPQAAADYSSRPLHILPLPPVNSEPFIESACKYWSLDSVSGLRKAQREQRALIRTILGQASFNALYLQTTYENIISETTVPLTKHLQTLAYAVESLLGSKARDFLMDEFFQRSDTALAKVFALIRALFWPLREEDGRLGLASAEGYAALFGDAFGICAVLRQYDPISGRAQDTVAMNPWMCALLCRLLINHVGEAKSAMDRFVEIRKEEKQTLDDLKEQLDEKERPRRILAATLATIRAEEKKLETKLATLEGEREIVENKKKQLRSQKTVPVAAYIQLLASKTSDVDELKEKRALNARVVVFDQQINTLNQNINALNEQITPLMQQITVTSQQNTATFLQILAADRELSPLNTQFIAAECHYQSAKRVPSPGPDCSAEFLTLLGNLLDEVCNMSTLGADAGKLHELVGARVLACRIATAPVHATIGDLLPQLKREVPVQDCLVSAVFTAAVPTDVSAHFPRGCALPCAATHDNEKGGGCSRLPPAGTDGSWMVPAMHPQNAILDALVVVRAVLDAKEQSLCIGLRRTVHADDPSDTIAEHRRHRHKHMTRRGKGATGVVAAFLSQHTSVQVFMAPKALPF